MRLPKDQSTPINRMNRSDENQKQLAGGPIVDNVQMGKNILQNLPKPGNPLMPNKTQNIANRLVIYSLMSYHHQVKHLE